MSKNLHIPNPLKEMDKVWKKAAGPTQPIPSVKTKPLPPIVIAGTPKKKLRKKKSAIPENKI
jgi:hypothetical protein